MMMYKIVKESKRFSKKKKKKNQNIFFLYIYIYHNFIVFTNVNLP
jgi:hypothetical protein